MAHVTCLAAARHELLKRHGWDVEQNGLSGAPAIRVLASNRHGSIERAVRLLDLGARKVQDLGRRVEFRLDSNLRQPVLNQTGLRGRYEAKLEMALDLPGLVTAEPENTALISSVGRLKLEKRRVPVHLLIIDHIERNSGAN